MILDVINVDYNIKIWELILVEIWEQIKYLIKIKINNYLMKIIRI